MTNFEDFGGRGGGKCLLMIGEGGRRIGSSRLLNSVSEVLSEMFSSSDLDRETYKH